VKYAADVWSEVEREEFISWIAANPEAGDLIPGSVAAAGRFGGRRRDAGKRGGARVIYTRDGVVWLLIVYAKSKFDNLPREFLAQLKRGIEDD
jgi:hypothetical protein